MEKLKIKRHTQIENIEKLKIEKKSAFQNEICALEKDNADLKNEIIEIQWKPKKGILSSGGSSSKRFRMLKNRVKQQQKTFDEENRKKDEKIQSLQRQVEENNKKIEELVVKYESLNRLQIMHNVLNF